ncbi:GNAT family N-acetyltransferase [Lacticaseibacillus chiayiensis]|uniref:GNAT family N-acetyltransferase n=1 Tax=Lacticaseibacillus chiayiensis TaxID=2100821 RepID=UPI001010D66C|nr:N-acetyltransferase [Lacticaseibacillus chiayiensis]RXT58022.1 GNAT family N-acetyltransferase [Lacticaseibacillus chiayiensis]
MKLHFSTANLTDLDPIMRIERAGFTPQEAASRSNMAARIIHYPDTFIVARTDQTIAGYIVGPATSQSTITDDLFVTSEPNSAAAPYIAILSLAVAPDLQHHGIGHQLLVKMTEVAREQKRIAITLTCLQRLIPFYEHAGFHNDGKAASTHAGEVWFNMTKSVAPVSGS